MDLIKHIQRQKAFSEKTFGPGERTAGLISHIKKELVEIEENPDDLEEWIDVVILALDGAWRCGWSPEQIAVALGLKLNKNESRKWPDWRVCSAGDPIEHIREKDI